MKRIYNVGLLVLVLACVLTLVYTRGNMEGNYTELQIIETCKTEDNDLCVQGLYTLDATETIVNSSGKVCELLYDSSIIWPESEEDVLAKFLCQEGGNAEEKARIAQIVVWHTNDNRYPDSVREVLCQKGLFELVPGRWNGSEPSEEDRAIAQAALASNEVPEYKSYCPLSLLQEMLAIYPAMDYEATENFAFFG